MNELRRLLHQARFDLLVAEDRGEDEQEDQGEDDGEEGGCRIPAKDEEIESGLMQQSTQLVHPCSPRRS
ncbi:MAG: hypothetical protein AAGK32_19630, partial [Actinomycetota bacterium]